MIDSETVRILATVIVIPLAGWGWKQWQARDAALQARGREEARAEEYKRTSTEALNQVKHELTQEQAENEELRSWILRLTDNDIPRLRTKLDERDLAIAKFSDAFQRLADQKAVES